MTASRVGIRRAIARRVVDEWTADDGSPGRSAASWHCADVDAMIPPGAVAHRNRGVPLAMSREDIVAIAVRLFAVYLLVTSLRTLASVPAVLTGEVTAGTIVVTLVALACTLGIIVLLWRFPLTIAGKLLPVMKTPRPGVLSDGGLLFPLGIVLIGLWQLAAGLADVVYWATMLLVMRNRELPLDALRPEQWGSMVGTAAQVVVALALILGSNGLHRLLYRIRYGHDTATGPSAISPPSPSRD